MKILLILFILFSLSFSKQDVFMLNTHDKETEIEAKIIQRIAKSSLKESIKIFIPNITSQERDIYSEYFEISEDCQSANFVFDKDGLSKYSCENVDKLFFTNNYKRLIANQKYYGAFFWNKSRPNIVFIQQRLNKNNIILTDEYTQFIEDSYD